jgi:hypothetical protein
MQKENDFWSTDSLIAPFNSTMRQKHQSYHQYIDILFQNYIENLGKEWGCQCCDDTTIFNKMLVEVKPKVTELSDLINKTLIAYLKGSPFEATTIFFKAMDNIIQFLEKNISPMPMSIDTCFYRIRVGDSSSKIETREDMFHVPISLRHKIFTSRYSIPGYPCLYLSSSLYTCWEELGRPCFNNIYFSRFVYEPQGLKLLHLQYDLASWKQIIEFKKNDQEKLQNIYESFKNTLICYPLQLACSIPVKIKSINFQEEYIIPQLLMQWLKQKFEAPLFNGICYRTSHVPLNYKNPVSPYLLWNYVFPIQNVDHDYCSELKNLFRFTEPISYELSLSVPPRGQNYSNYNPSSATRFNFAHSFSIMDGLQTKYGYTNFYKAEEYSDPYLLEKLN